MRLIALDLDKKDKRVFWFHRCSTCNDVFIYISPGLLRACFDLEKFKILQDVHSQFCFATKVAEYQIKDFLKKSKEKI